MDHSTHVEIAAPPERVWTVLADVERWPSWTPTVSSLTVLDAPRDGRAALARGSRMRIVQPGVSTTVYTVTEVADGRHFRWESHRPGVHLTADHHVEPLPGGRTRATLRFAVGGPLGRLMSPLLRSRIRGMTHAEGEALRDRVENGPAGQEP